MPSQKQLQTKYERLAKAATEWQKRSFNDAQRNMGARAGDWGDSSLLGVDVDAYRQMIGGNPYTRQLEQVQSQMNSGSGSSSNSGGGGLAALTSLQPLLQAYYQMQNASSQPSQQSIDQQLNQQYAQQLAAANQANEYRYQQGLGELAGLRTRSMDDIRSIGEQQAADIDQRFKESQADVDQDLRRRGLLGTTITSSTRRTMEEGRANAQGRLADQLARARIDADNASTGNLVNFIERRTDQGPDMSQLTQLQQGLGASGYGGTAFARPSVGHYGPGTTGGGSYAPPSRPSVGHYGPGTTGSGGSYAPPSHPGMGPGVGGPNQTGYPTVNNGVVEGWQGGSPNVGPGVGGAAPIAPITVGGGFGGNPYHYGGGPGGSRGFLRAGKTDPIQNAMQQQILQALRGLGSTGGQPQQQPRQQSQFSAPMSPRPLSSGPIFTGTGPYSAPGAAYGQRPTMGLGVGYNYSGPGSYGRPQQSPAPSPGGSRFTPNQANALRQYGAYVA